MASQAVSTPALSAEDEAFIRGVKTGSHEVDRRSVGSEKSGVEEEFNPEVTRLWNDLQCIIKLWFVTSVLTMPIALLVHYSVLASVVGMAGALVYLCKCCLGGIHGFTQNRIITLKILSLATVVIGLLIVGVEIIKVTIALHTSKHYLLLEYAGSISGLLLHSLVSAKVFRGVSTILNTLETALTLGADLL